MDWMLMPLRRYADFSGRSRRMEYWMYVLGCMIAFAVVGVIFGVVLGAASSGGAVNPDGSPSAGLLGGSMLLIGGVLVLALALLVPTIAVQVRRLHDQNLSGWIVLIGYIPIVNYIGGIVLLVFMCLPGTVGPNKYGPDPLEGERLGAGVGREGITY